MSYYQNVKIKSKCHLSLKIYLNEDFYTNEMLTIGYSKNRNIN